MHLQAGQGQHSPLGQRQALASCLPSALRLAGQRLATPPTAPRPSGGGNRRAHPADLLAASPRKPHGPLWAWRVLLAHHGDTAMLRDTLGPGAGPLTHLAGPSPPPAHTSPGHGRQPDGMVNGRGGWAGSGGKGAAWTAGRGRWVNSLARERVSRPGEWRGAEGATTQTRGWTGPRQELRAP